MLRDWDKQYPGRIETMFSAMQNVVPSHLNDHKLFDFKSITHDSDIIDGGDLAFDREALPLNPVGWQPEDDEDTENVHQYALMCWKLNKRLISPASFRL